MSRLLAFDTSTEHLSVAVLHGERLLAHNGVGGAQASTTLLPLIQQLLGEAGLALAELDAIVFGRGPGSFTGLRTACSVAQGLAFGADVPLLPVDTLLAVAEEARHAFGAQQVVAVLDARMDQLYAARYDFSAAGPLGSLGGDDEPLLLSPEALEVPGAGRRPPRGPAHRHRHAAARARAARGRPHRPGGTGLAALCSR